jgi:hypothetical protein
VCRATKHFFIPMVHSPPGVVGHVIAPELPSQEGRAQSRETRDSTEAHLVKETRSRVEAHVIALELTSVRRRDPRPWDMWQRRSSPQYGGEVPAHGTHGGARAYLYKKV